MSEMINHPQHYTQAGVMLEPIDVLRFAPFDLGNCLKYILRAGHKGDALQDWKKAEKYLGWAKYGYYHNKPIYDDFFNHYHTLLFKFEVFDWCESRDIYSFFDEIEAMIADNITEGEE